MGKSREYVSNTLRILMLPDEMLQALAEGKMTEGHTRPLMMLVDRPEEQMTLFKEILFKKVNVREAEGIARRIAFEKARKLMDPDLVDLEEKFKDTLGTRVRIEKRDEGGKITIDFFSKGDLLNLLDKISKNELVIPKKVDDIPAPTEEEKVEMAEGSKEAMEAPEEDLYSVKNFSI